MEILIIREEIICILILLVMLFYYIANGGIRNKGKNTFVKLVVCALCHLVLEVVTVITVNHRDIVPDICNRVLHILFFLAGIIFIMEFFQYVLRLTLSLRWVRRLRVIAYVPCGIFAISMFVFPVEYCSGNGTDYSSGPLVMLGYGICALYCISSLAIMLIWWKWIDRRVKCSVVPMNCIILFLILAQMIFPEMLFTGAIVTLVSIGVFFSLDNPIEWYKKQAYWDMDIKIKNKNSFLMELDRMKSELGRKDDRLGFLVADVNGLKFVNDKYGHAMGDDFIRVTAKILKDNLKSAYGVYRIGGDEFVAIYTQPDENLIRAEIEDVRKTCNEEEGVPVYLSIAMGYAGGNVNQIGVNKILDEADRKMYEDKRKTKACLSGEKRI